MNDQQRAQYEQRVKRLEAASVDQQLQINNLRTMLELLCGELREERKCRLGLQQRLDRLDDVRDRQPRHAIGSNGSWLVG